MSKKMWNKIFKSKSNKNSKTLQAASKINKRSSIYEEYQQLNAALDLSAPNDKFGDGSDTPDLSISILNTPSPPSSPRLPTRIPQTTTFTKVVNSLTLKRSQNTNGGKDAKSGNGNEGKEKNSKKSELKTISSSQAGEATSINQAITIDHHSSYSNSSFNTPYYDASLNQQEQQLTATTDNIATASAATLNLNNNNNNEYLACNKNLTNPNFKQQQKRLSQIVIVVRKLIDTTSASSSSDLATNFNNQTTTATTNCIATTNHLNNTLSTALETSSLTASNAAATATVVNDDQNQLSVNTKNDVGVVVSDHYINCLHDDRKFCFNSLDNGNNIATPTEIPTETNDGVQLSPCPICARTFNPVTLRKHVGICEKMATKKRNIFDSSRQRREGTELATYPLPKNFGLPEKSASSTSVAQARGDRGHSPKPAVAQISSPLMTRKKPAEGLIRSTARASMRKVAASTTNTTPSAVNTTATTPSNFTRDRLRSSERSLTRRGTQPPPAEQCPHCERCFGIKAYDRHVEWCKEKALQAAIKQGNTKTDGNVAKARWEARTKYRAPCLKTKRSINREKYSGLPGDENEPDESPKYSKSSNKTQDNSLMTMSMTSSICSERKITNPTGNINEPSKTAIKTSATKANRKEIRDKSQTPPPQPPTPPTTETPPQQQQKSVTTTDDIKESIINLEFQMPDFHLMGEQLVKVAINKNLKNKTTSKSISSNVSKSKPQQIKIRKSDRELETTDVTTNSLPTASLLAQNKNPSDLSLQSLHTIHFKDAFNADESNDDDDDGGDEYDHKNNDGKIENLKFEEKISSNQNVNLSSVLMPLKVKERNDTKANKKPADDTKMTMEDNINKLDIVRQKNKTASPAHNKEKHLQSSANILNIGDNCTPLGDNLQDCHILGSKKAILLRNGVKTGNKITKFAIEETNQSATSLENVDLMTFSDQISSSAEDDPSVRLNLDYNENNYDHEEMDKVHKQILASIPKITIPKSQLRSQYMQPKQPRDHALERTSPIQVLTKRQTLTEAKSKNRDSTAERSKCRTSSKPLQRPLTPTAQQQLSTPSPPLTTPAAFTPNSRLQNIQTNLGTSSIKSLNICRSRRKTDLRQTVSCSSVQPMKAIPLFRESIEKYGVSPAPQIKHVEGGNKECTKNYIEVDVKNAEVEEDVNGEGNESGLENSCAIMDKEIKVIKDLPQLKRNKSFTVSGLPDNYDPFLSAKRQLEELCSPTPSDSAEVPQTTPQTPQLPSLPATPNINKMSTSLILSSSTPNATPSPMTTSQIPQQTTPKTPTMVRSSSFRRTASLRGPRRSPMLSARPPLFAQKQRPTIQRGLSDEGPISTNFLKPEEYDEMPVRSVCVNDFAITNSPRVVRRDTTALNRKQPTLKLNINAASANGGTSASGSPNITEPDVVPTNTAFKYVSKTDSLAVFLKYEHELEKLNSSGIGQLEDIKEPTTTTPSSSDITTPLTNLDGPLNAKELKDKSNNLSKQNSAKNIKADLIDLTETQENYDHNSNTASASAKATNELDCSNYGQVRLQPLATSKPTTPLTKPSTPLTKPTTPITCTVTKPSTPQYPPTLTPLNVKNIQQPLEHVKTPKSPMPVALSSIFSGERTTKQPTHSSLLYAERKNSLGSDYIDPKLINKCDNLPINLNLKRSDFKHSDSDTSEPRMEQFSSSSSSESSAPAKKQTSLTPNSKFLPLVKQQQQQEQTNNSNNLNQNHSTHQHNAPPPTSNSQRNSAEGRNLLKRRMRLGRNQFLYDASPEGDSCSADDEANRSSMECDNHNFMKDHEKTFERLSAAQMNPIDAPFIPPLPAFDDFDFEEFLSSFENDEEQFPIFKDCREFLLNRTSKKQRSMLMTNSNTLLNNNNNSTNFKKSSPQTFPPLTPQAHSSMATQQHFQFPSLPQHPKNLFNSFSLNNTRARNKYDDLANTKSTDTFVLSNANEEDQKREIFISIETEQNDLDKSPISPNSIRNMVGNPQTVVEVEVDSAHDNKFSKISDDDADCAQIPEALKSSMTRSKHFPGHLEHLPNVQLNNAKNLIQQMQEDFRQMGDEMNANIRQTMDHRSPTAQPDINSNSSPITAPRNIKKVNKSTGTPSGDAYADSDELSSLDGYPLSSPNSRLGVSSKTSADSAYGSLSRQRSSELSSQRNSSRNRPITTSSTANTLMNRPLAEESSLGRSRQLSASSSSSSEHALPPIVANNSFTKQQQQLQQHLYNNNTVANDLNDMMRYERNNNYDVHQPMHHPSTSAGTAAANSHSNLESSSQLYSSNSTMSTSMKMSRFCHECGSKFLVEQAKFCMDCGVKRIVL